MQGVYIFLIARGGEQKYELLVDGEKKYDDLLRNTRI